MPHFSCIPMRYFSILFLFICTSIFAQVKSPADFLGYELGEQFTRHSDVVRYFEHVAANSNMVTYQNYGKTNERRPLTYAVVSTPENIANLSTIKANNRKNAGLDAGNASINPETAIVWLSYNVHGNEASSTEAAMNTIYKLITEDKDYLSNTVVIIDPCVNPDGRDRYVNWFNEIHATPYNTDPQAAEHNEPWPGGRPNHYLYDLNRDWAWATQVETQQRLVVYNQFMPHIHVDFHEQEIDNPYYFAPAAEPFHEIITDFQRDFQVEIGKNNAKYFDEKGRLFFTRQYFDLLYPSYGDTYPLYMGAIGMTYEKAGHGRAGLGIKTGQGYVLTLKDRLTDHTTTGLSTVEIANKNAGRLNSEFKKFFNSDNTKTKSFVMQGNEDNLNALAKLLDRHEIKFAFTDGKISGFNYTEGKNGSLDAKNALVVSTNQPRGKMVKALFEANTKLSTPLTYDITAWSLPYAYGFDAVESSTIISGNASKAESFTNNIPTATAVGYLAKWNSMNDATFLSDLLQNNIRVRFSEKELSFEGKKYDRGSLVITRSDNFNNTAFDAKLIEIANKHNRKITATATSFADKITDFGSPDIKLINKQKIAVLQGEKTSSLSYGSIWYYFEQELKYPITSINTDDFGDSDLSKYNVLVMPDGSYSSLLNEDGLKKIKEFVSNGGKVIAIANAIKAFKDKEGFGIIDNKTDKDSTDVEVAKKDKETSEKSEFDAFLVPYDQREKNDVKDLLIGSIYKVKLDNSHPMAFGYDDTYYSLKLGAESYSFLEEGYNVGYIKGDAVSMSGFSGEDAKKGLLNSIVFAEKPMGKGSIIYFVDDVLFRSFWQNGKLLFANSLFFVNATAFEME